MDFATLPPLRIDKFRYELRLIVIFDLCIAWYIGAVDIRSTFEIVSNMRYAIASRRYVGKD